MNTIFYFTGTGNCLQVARELAARFPEDVNLIRVCSDTLYLAKEKYSGRIGIVYPTYSNTMPIMLKNFLEELQVEDTPDNYIYTVCVHGGMPGRVHVFLESVFRRKGTPVNGAFLVRLPHNGIVIFDAEPEEKQRLWFEGLPARVQEIVDAVMAETPVTCGNTSPSPKAIKALGLKLPPGPPPDEQMAPNPIFDPQKREKEFFADERCIGCGTCVSVCPADNIVLEDGHPVWKGHCESCMACFQWCPAECVQFADQTQSRRRYHNPNIKLNEIRLR